MTEKADFVLTAPFTQGFGARNEMIVMNPDDIVSLEFFFEVLGEKLIDAEITT